MSKKFGITVLVISIIACLISLFAIVRVQEQQKENAQDIQYVMYVGTNDKDTVLPVFERDIAKEKAIEILLRHFGGYTIQEAEGGWIDGDKVFTEYTLVIYLSDTDLESVHAAADEMITTFRQSSILIQSNKTVTEFYAGK